MFNQQTIERIESIKQSLENNHAGNPLVISDAVEIDQYGLAETHFVNYLPHIDRSAYAKIGKRTMLGTLRVYHDGSGLFYTQAYDDLNTSLPSTGVWQPYLGRLKIRFWRFGCQHDYRDMTEVEKQQHGIILGRCEHANICKECGHVWVYDSSD